MEASLARRLWRVGEPVHAIIYFHPASASAWQAAGIRGFWRGYFATRAAPLGHRVATTLGRLAGRVAGSGVIRFPNPMGLPAPT